MPADRPQTSVRISPAAAIALKAIGLHRSLSRDATIRALITEYIGVQLPLSEENRLTHISTVLRYPPQPIDRDKGDGRIRIAFRLDPGDADRAAALALKLPGQPPRRGPRDYSPRPLTDALNVAIARAKPYVDFGLEGLPQLITQGAAQGLWRLTVAATLTRAEQRLVLTNADPVVGSILRDQEVAWHSPWRFEVALHLARKLLIGTCQKSNLALLRQQYGDFEAMRYDLERTAWEDSELMRDCRAVSLSDLEGRGGSVVWRAERKLTEEAITSWLARPNPQQTYTTLQPGWSLIMPPGWTTQPYQFGQRLAAEHQEDVDSGQVLQIIDGPRMALWPYGPNGKPLARFHLALAEATWMPPARLVELVLLEGAMNPWVPVELAVAWGLISASHGADLTTQATVNRRQTVASAQQHHWRRLDDVFNRLGQLMDEPAKFAHLASQRGIRGGPFQAGWRWPVGSLTDVFTSDRTDDQVKWLIGAYDVIRTWHLEQSMRHAARIAYWRGQPDADQVV